MARTPDFFIVGSAKCGTTSLWMYLKQHPDIFMPKALIEKEPSYFCHNYGIKNYAAYLSLFDAASTGQAVGEASTAYLTSPESAEWIHRANPRARIIVMLRNPVDRAYSLYRWMVNSGYEWIDSFEAALLAEASRINDYFYFNNSQYYYNYLYFSSGLYSAQLSRYYKFFPATKIKLVLLDDLTKEPGGTLRDIYQFLGIDKNFNAEVKVHNKADIKPCSIWLNNALRQVSRRFMGRKIGIAADLLRKANLNLSGKHWDKMSDATRCSLVEKYRLDVSETEKIAEVDLKSWIK